MIRLHYSNRLENLIAPLANAVAEHQRREPLEPVSIVVPNRVVEQFVRYRLAESIGVAANLKFPFLRSYLAELLQSTDQNLKILDADELQLILFECLRSSSHRDDPELEAGARLHRGGSKTDADVELQNDPACRAVGAAVSRVLDFAAAHDREMARCPALRH